MLRIRSIAGPALRTYLGTMEPDNEQDLVAAIRSHEREIARLEGQLASLQSVALDTQDDASAAAIRDQVISLTAAATGHRISTELLRSRLSRISRG